MVQATGKGWIRARLAELAALGLVGLAGYFALIGF